MELKGKNILIVGAGKTGQALMNFLIKEGANITINDKGNLPDNFRVPGPSVKTVWGGHPEDLFLSSDIVVLSPGVPLRIPAVQWAMEKGIPVIGELELASEFITLPAIAVTGTNGKTTTTTLVGEMLRNAGVDTFVGGNIGRPLISLCTAHEAYKWAVLEVSSFQLATARNFHPRIAAILNIEPDHLDWHNSLQDYRRAKWSVAENMDASDTLVLYAPLLNQRPPNLKPAIYTFTDIADGNDAAYIEDEALCWEFETGFFNVPISDLRLQQTHILLDMLAAGLLSYSAGVPGDVIRDTLRTFHGLPHRMEIVGEINGVRFINDSKATNVDAVLWALRSLTGGIIWLAGGLWKGGDISALSPEVKAKVKAIISFGSSSGMFRDFFSHRTKTYEVKTLDDAVALASELAVSGDCVLLSPACASFDQFKDYRERGRAFVNLVTSLKAKDNEAGYVSA